MTEVYLKDVLRQKKRLLIAYFGTRAGWAVGIIGTLAALGVMAWNHWPPVFYLLALVPMGYGVYIYMEAQQFYKPEFSEAAGNATWVTRRELKHAGMIKTWWGRGRRINPACHPYIGKFAAWSWWRFRTVWYNVYYPGKIHWTMCGPTGVGKDTGLICCNIRDLVRMSMVILDIKGEAAARCANWLRKLGYQVVILNVCNWLVNVRPDLVSQGYNCLADFTVEHPKCYEYCRMNSSAMIVRRNGESGHWDARAMALLTFCQLAVKWSEYLGRLLDENNQPCKRSATLDDVNKMLWAPYRYKHKPGKNKPITSLHQIIHDAMTLEDQPGQPPRETLRQAAAAFYSENLSDEEISGAINTAKGQLEPLLGETVKLDMRKHPLVWIDQRDAKGRKTGKRIQVPFKFEYLRDEPIKVFVIVPFEEMYELAIWTRLVITKAIKGIVRGDRKPKVNTWLVINEAHAIGDLGVLRDALATVRYAGLRIWTIWQDFDQILKNFGSFGAFLTNAGVINTYRVGERTTAEEFRWRLGITTAITEAVSSAPKHDNQQRNKTRQGSGVNLMNLEKLTALSERETIAFVPEYLPGKPIKLHTPLRLSGLDAFMESEEDEREAA